jgi:hypothetical protein
MENGANGTEQLQLLKMRLHMFMDTMKELLMSGQNQTYVEEVSEEKPVAKHCWYTVFIRVTCALFFLVWQPKNRGA